jgi:hypothetical protein
MSWIGLCQNNLQSEKVLNVINSKLVNAPIGEHDLAAALNENNNIELDWISFEYK